VTPFLSGCVRPAGAAASIAPSSEEAAVPVRRLPRRAARSLLAALVLTATGAARETPSLAAQQRAGAPALSPLAREVDRRGATRDAKVVAWRRDFHEHPELGFEETRTSAAVAAHLRALGLEVRTGLAKTGVIGILRGGKPGSVVALRADMDALPVTEDGDLPFRSRVTATYNGQTVGVMHACGHDAHTAMLMGAAEALAGVKAQLPGTVVFVFQPAEEGAPPGQLGGAAQLLADGALDDPKPQAIFGLHVLPLATGTLVTRAGGIMASADQFRLVVHGSQTHGAQPWRGVDPITIGAQIVGVLQTIPSRQLDITQGPAIVTVGSFNGGVRNNIIPDSVVMTGTLRAFDERQRADLQLRVRRTAEQIAAASGATATVQFGVTADLTANDPALVAQMQPTLRRVAGDLAGEARPVTVSEDFAAYQQRMPGMFVFLGVTEDGVRPEDAAPNHSPRFRLNEAALPTGTRALAAMAVDWLEQARR
jgi:amidohydrolase